MNRIESIIFTFRVPQRAPFTPSSLPKERRLLTLHSHAKHILDDDVDLDERCWRIMDSQFHCLENLQALHFSLQSSHPDFRGSEKAWVERIMSHLRLLQDRESVALSFIVDGKVVPWVVMSRPLPLELQLQVLGHVTSNSWKLEDRIRVLSICCSVC